MSISKEINSITLYKWSPVITRLDFLPFLPLYIYGFYFLATTTEYFELALIACIVIAFLHILTFLMQYWSVDFKCFVGCNKVTNINEASFLKVTPNLNKGKKELCSINRSTETSTGEITSFTYQKRKFFYSDEDKTFHKLAFSVNKPFEFYCRSKGLKQSDLADLSAKYGPNKFEIPLPTFSELYKEQALAPFFVFQIFCVLLWCMDEYWYYSLFTLFMLLIFEATVVQSRITNLKSLRSMSLPPQPVQVLRDSKWVTMESYQLVPGDICLLGRSSTGEIACPCDMLLLSGTCVVNEAMLTGESTPHLKESVMYRNPSDIVDMKKDGLHILYSGTKILQQSSQYNSKLSYQLPHDAGCVGYVLKTGFSTTQGNLMRVILFSTERVTVNTKESLMFIAFLLVFALTASGYVLQHGLEDPNRSRYKLFLECVLIITSVVPPELPMELSLAVNTSLLALHRLGIFCTEPFRIPFGGKVDVCCFDKTGTLTSDDLVLKGVAGIKSDKSLSDPSQIPDETAFILASCQSLVHLEGKLTGDPMEVASMKAIKWHTGSGDIVSSNKKELRIVHRHHFTSALKRMSAVVALDHERSLSSIAVAKGAPEKMMEFFDTSNLPVDYEETYKQYSIAGARVLALGYKPLQPGQTSDLLRKIPREEVESNLIFAGFAVFDCPLKQESASTISLLKDSSHEVVMITGDNSLTACQVATDLEIATKPVLIFKEDLSWVSIDEKLTFSSQSHSIPELAKNYDFCVSGASFAAFMNTPSCKRYTVNVCVWARVSPDQKEMILAVLKNQGFTTLMCGDGTNDVGALKQSHVGVALLNAPTNTKKKSPSHQSVSAPNLVAASKKEPPKPGLKPRTSLPIGTRPTQSKDALGMRTQSLLKQLEEESKSTLVQLGDASFASPFTIKSGSVFGVSHIIRQGRCTLVTTHQMFKILALNCLISAYSLSVLYLDGVKMGDSQATLAGMLIAMCFLFISRSKPLENLSKKRPKSHIFNPYLMLSVMCQFAIHLFSLIYVVNLSNSAAPRTEKVDLEAEFAPNLLNSAVFLISVAMQVTTFAINYKGHPFMQSLTENKPLRNCLALTGGFVLLMTAEVIPSLNEYFQLSSFPDDLFRANMLLVIIGDFVSCWIVENMFQKLFE